MSTQYVLAQDALKCENKRGSGAPESATTTPLLAESMPWPRLLVLTLLATITKLIGANTAKSQPGKRIQFWNLSFHQEAERKEVKVWEKIQKKNYDQKENYYQKEDYYQKEGNHLRNLEDMILKDGNYQYTVEYKTQRASCYNAPKNLFLNYLKKSQSWTSNLKSTSLNLLTSCQVKKKEAEIYPNYTTETYRNYRMERKMKKVKEEKEKEAGERDKEERKRKKERRRERKSKERSKKTLGNPG